MRFTQPVSMKVNQDQFIYLAKELEKRGYKLTNYTDLEDADYIATNLRGLNDQFSNFMHIDRNDRNRYCIDHYNPELFLALASMTDEKYGISGEYIIYIGGDEGILGKEKLYKLLKPLNEEDCFIDDSGQLNNYFTPFIFENVRKATKEEIINQLTKNNMNEIYQVKQSDLVGQIANFPIEVVQKMVERQVEQYGKADIKQFQECRCDGFTWSATIEGNPFWSNVIIDEDFNSFFSKYPKRKSSTEVTHKVTRSQMADIHSIACVTWKEKLTNLMSLYFTPFSDEAELPNSEVKSMFEAAIPSQKHVLERIFPNYGIRVLAKDTPVMVSDDNKEWNVRYYSDSNKTFNGRLKSDKSRATVSWVYIVPVSDFDFNDLESNASKSIV